MGGTTTYGSGQREKHAKSTGLLAERDHRLAELGENGLGIARGGSSGVVVYMSETSKKKKSQPSQHEKKASTAAQEAEDIVRNRSSFHT